jgi:hypothetical protein
MASAGLSSLSFEIFGFSVAVEPLRGENRGITSNKEGIGDEQKEFH